MFHSKHAGWLLYREILRTTIVKYFTPQFSSASFQNSNPLKNRRRNKMLVVPECEKDGVVTANRWLFPPPSSDPRSTILHQSFASIYGPDIFQWFHCLTNKRRNNLCRLQLLNLTRLHQLWFPSLTCLRSLYFVLQTSPNCCATSEAELDSHDCIRLQLDRNASRDCSHNALGYLTS